MSLKKSEHRKKKKLTDQNQPSGQQHKHDGDVHVHGAIEVHPPESLLRQHASEHQEDAAQHIAERREDRTRESSKVTREWLMFSAVVMYAGLTAGQAYLTRQIVQVAQKTYDASERPYIGVDKVVPIYRYVKGDTSGQPSGMDFQVQIKNFGPVPGTKFTADTKPFFNGKPFPSKEVASTPSKLFPTQIVDMRGVIQGDDFKALESETAILMMDITVEYYGLNGQHYRDCNEEQYSPPNRGFFNLGACTKVHGPVTEP